MEKKIQREFSLKKEVQKMNDDDDDRKPAVQIYYTYMNKNTKKNINFIYIIKIKTMSMEIGERSNKKIIKAQKKMASLVTNDNDSNSASSDDDGDEIKPYGEGMGYEDDFLAADLVV